MHKLLCVWFGHEFSFVFCRGISRLKWCWNHFLLIFCCIHEKCIENLELLTHILFSGLKKSQITSNATWMWVRSKIEKRQSSDQQKSTICAERHILRRTDSYRAPNECINMNHRCKKKTTNQWHYSISRQIQKHHMKKMRQNFKVSKWKKKKMWKNNDNNNIRSGSIGAQRALADYEIINWSYRIRPHVASIAAAHSIFFRFMGKFWAKPCVNFNRFSDFSRSLLLRFQH